VFNNPESQPPYITSQSCDLCGSSEADYILSTKRLDGPLLRCRHCRLFYVDLSQLSHQPTENDVKAEMVRLAERATELALVEPQVEENENPWRELMAQERLADLRRFICSGRLLEIGSSTGEMLACAAGSFTASGVEADAKSSRIARSRGLDCFNGDLIDAQFIDQYFDVVASYHVIEHFRSPRAELREMHRILKPGGWLAIETPNISTVWYQLLGARWRQFIPDHLFFFTPQTITALCKEIGFEIVEVRRVGKAMSMRLFINRLGRYHESTGRLLMTLSNRLNLSDRTVRLNLGDVMRLYARRL